MRYTCRCNSFSVLFSTSVYLDDIKLGLGS